MGKWFCYDPDNGHEFFDSQEEAIAAAEKATDDYLDGEWLDGVEEIYVGYVTHKATLIQSGEHFNCEVRVTE